MAIQNNLNIIQTGILAADGNGDFDGRTLTAGVGITIANGDGTAGNPTISGTEFPTDAGTATPAANALTITGGNGINTSGAGAVATINLDAPVTVANGGTGATGFTAGSVIFSNGTILTEDNANLFWDDTNNRLGIGTATPLDTVHISGSMDLDHTATEDDDHAFEIVCDANGFADVKAIDIDYITGTMAAGQDEEAILVNIDESASTGGIMAGYLCLTTSEGSATINGYETGININPVVQQSGTFGDADSILNKAVDVTAALAAGGAGAISIFVADNDTLTIGDAAQWGEHEIILSTGASGAGVAPTFEYSTGGAAFSAFSPADGTNGFKNSGAILWDASSLAGWATATSGLYEIRITRTRNTLTTTPIIEELQISALTEFKWDKNGDVNLNSLTLLTDLAVAHGGTGASALTGVLTGNGVAAITGNAVTQYSPIIGGAVNAVASVAVGTSGQVLQSKGAGVAADYSTATYPATTTVSQILYSSATNTVSGLATGNNGVLITSATGVPSLLAAGTTGQVLTATTGAPATWGAAPAGSGWVFLDSATAAASATLDFAANIDATYNLYAFVLSDILPATDNATFQVLTSANAGVSYDTGATDYSYAYTYQRTSSLSAAGSLGSPEVRIAISIGNTIAEVCNGILYLYNPSSVNYTQFSYSLTYAEGLSRHYTTFGSGTRNSSAAVNAFRFIFTTGNIASGTIRMYGCCTPA